MTPENIINTKPKEKSVPTPVEEVTEQQPVKKARRKKSLFDRFDIASWLDYETIAPNLSFVLFIALLLLMYIWNNHYASRSINYINQNDKKLKELKWQYIYSKAELERSSQQSEVAKALQVTGVKELKNPPVKIYLTTNGKN